VNWYDTKRFVLENKWSCWVCQKCLQLTFSGLITDYPRLVLELLQYLLLLDALLIKSSY